MKGHKIALVKLKQAAAVVLTSVIIIACEFNPQPEPLFPNGYEISQTIPKDVGLYYSPHTKNFTSSLDSIIYIDDQKYAWSSGHPIYIGDATVSLFDKLFSKIFEKTHRVSDAQMSQKRLSGPTFEVKIAGFAFKPGHPFAPFESSRWPDSAAHHHATIFYQVNLFSSGKEIIWTWADYGYASAEDCQKGGRTTDAIACAMEDAVSKFIVASNEFRSQAW